MSHLYSVTAVEKDMYKECSVGIACKGRERDECVYMCVYVSACACVYVCVCTPGD